MTQLEETSPQKERLARSLRKLIDGLTLADLPEDILGQIAAEIENQNAMLRGFPTRAARRAFGKASSADDRRSFREHSPLTGICSPIAPPLTLRIEIDQDGRSRVVGEVKFGWAYEGPPGHVHGGYVAAIFDELLGLAQTLSGEVGMTGKLTTRFRLPTPLHTTLTLIGSFERMDGRCIRTTGKLFAGDRLTADAEGLFMRLEAEHLDSLDASRTEALHRISDEKR
jgi:acyl-coenzyme A thioesterase PaaI-like protein